MYFRKIYEAHAIHCRGCHLLCIFLRVALAPSRVSGLGDIDFDWSHEGEGFPVSVIHDHEAWQWFPGACDYPAHQQSLEILSRHVLPLRSYGIRIQIDSYCPFINKLFMAVLWCRISHARHRQYNRCFRKSCLTDVLTATACTWRGSRLFLTNTHYSILGFILTVE